MQDLFPCLELRLCLLAETLYPRWGVLGVRLLWGFGGKASEKPGGICAAVPTMSGRCCAGSAGCVSPACARSSQTFDAIEPLCCVEVDLLFGFQGMVRRTGFQRRWLRERRLGLCSADVSLGSRSSLSRRPSGITNGVLNNAAESTAGTKAKSRGS